MQGISNLDTKLWLPSESMCENVRSPKKTHLSLVKIWSIMRGSSVSIRDGHHFLSPFIPVCSVFVMGATSSLHHRGTIVSGSTALWEAILVVASFVVMSG